MQNIKQLEIERFKRKKVNDDIYREKKGEIRFQINLIILTLLTDIIQLLFHRLIHYLFVGGLIRKGTRGYRLVQLVYKTDIP